VILRYYRQLHPARPLRLTLLQFGLVTLSVPTGTGEG